MERDLYQQVISQAVNEVLPSAGKCQRAGRAGAARQVKSGWAGGSPAPAVITVPRTENLVPGPASRDPPGKGSGEQTQRHEESCQSLKERLQQIHRASGSLAALDQLHP